MGCTVGFPSAALLDLQELETRPQYKFDTVLSDVFAVSAIFMLSLLNFLEDVHVHVIIIVENYSR